MASKQYYDSSVKSQYGYPTPGKQNVTAEDIMNSHYFMSDEDWESNRECEDFDYVIIGSSFCAFAFTTQALKNNPDAKILIIERGTYLHPDHYQNLPPSFTATVLNPSETFPWHTSPETHNGEYIKGLHGAYNFFGGRSSFWSGWCPEPTEAELKGWPKKVISTVKDYFPKAKELLQVTPADKIFKMGDEAHHQPVFGKLQSEVQSELIKASSTIEAVNDVIPAPLAVEAKMQRYEHYRKYCVIGPLLHRLNKSMPADDEQSQTGKMNPSLQAIINCLVKKVHHDGNGKATWLETSKGRFILGKAKLVLAMGILPSTTLVLNSFDPESFPALSHVGKRFAAHFISSIIARVPQSTLRDHNMLGNMEFGAVYVAGMEKDSEHQFHVQITAVHDKTPECEENIHDRIHHLPDVLVSPSDEQLKTSKDHIIFVCACLGELDYNNDKNSFQLRDTGGNDITCNGTLQAVANDTDNALWDTMDESTFQLLENILPLDEGLEYWNSDSGSSSGWTTTRPPKKQRRHDGLVHEASTMWIGDENDKTPVGPDYRLRGIDNVYITGASLFPTGGSWNPVGTIVSLAMHLADQICPCAHVYL